MADEGKKQSKENKAPQPDEGKKQPKERKVNLPEFIKKADPAELLALAQQTALVNHPLVRNFNDASAPAFYQKAEDLRRLLNIEQKKHADFRNRVVFLIARKAAASGKQAGKESAAPSA